MEWEYVFLIALVLDFIVALIGKKKKMGYWGLFGISLCFSPLVGLIVGLSVPDVQEEKIPEGNQSSRIISDLANLKAIKDSGILTDEEYKAKEEALKKVLLNPSVNADPKTKIKIRHNATGAVTTISLYKWNEMKLANTDKDYTPILIVQTKTAGNYVTLTVHDWNEIKEKGQQDSYKIIEGSDIC